MATAVAIAGAFYTQPADAVVAANGTDGSSLVDALSAGPLAGQANLPPLLTAPGPVSAPTLKYLQAPPKPQALWVIGGRPPSARRLPAACDRRSASTNRAQGDARGPAGPRAPCLRTW